MQATRFIYAATAVVLALALAGPAHAQDRTFTGDAGTDWNDPANWEPEELPSSGSSVLITAGETAQLAGGAGAAASVSLPVGAQLIVSGATTTLELGQDSSSFAGSLFVQGGARLELRGNTTWSAGNWQIGFPVRGGQIENRGHLTITGNVTTTGDGELRNSGTITRTGSSGAAAIAGPFTNDGLIVVQSGELKTKGLTQRAGDIVVAAGATLGHRDESKITIDGGTVSGAGTVAGAVTNNGGIVRPGRPAAAPGLLTIDGTYAQGPGGTLAVEIEGSVPGAGYDRLAVKGERRWTERCGSAASPASTPRSTVPTTSSPRDLSPGRSRRWTGGGTCPPKSATSRNTRRCSCACGCSVASRSSSSPASSARESFASRATRRGRTCPRGSQTDAMRLGPDGIADLGGQCGAPDGEAGLVKIVLGADIYDSTLRFLNEIAPDRAHVFSWDWRKSPEQSLARLDALVDRVGDGEKVVLMAHSMGGLLTRWYIDDPGRAQKVARAVTIGTPYWGSAKALFPLAAGVETPLPSALDALFSNAELKQFAGNLQGLYFLWPSADYGRWLTVDGVLSGPGQTGPLAAARVRGRRWAATRCCCGGRSPRHAVHLDHLKRTASTTTCWSAPGCRRSGGCASARRCAKATTRSGIKRRRHGATRVGPARRQRRVRDGCTSSAGSSTSPCPATPT